MVTGPRTKQRRSTVVSSRRPTTMIRLALYCFALAFLYFFLSVQHWSLNLDHPQHPVAAEEEKQRALEYVNSFQTLGKSLEFFHIPKTAGTAVEQAAGKQHLAWGSCVFPHRPKRDICKYPTGKDWPKHVGWWHVPAFLFPIVDKDKDGKSILIQPYQNNELFGIIRHPLDRMLSEYHYICSLKVFDWRPDQCDRSRFTDTQYMNQWIRDKLNQERTNDYLRDNGHFTSQYDFVFGPNQVRMLDYVIRMEELDAKYPMLMQAFGLSHLQLEQHNALGAASRSGATTTMELEETTKQTIRDMYPGDFAIGSYD